MKLKRAGAVLLAAALIGTTAVPQGVYAEENQLQVQAEEENGAVQKTLSQIVLSVGDGQSTPTYKAGEQAELQINVTNKGNVDAQNVNITPVINNTDDWPFDVSQLNYDHDLGTITAGNQGTAKWGDGDEKLTVRDDVSGKSYKLQFKISYNDGEKNYELDKYVFVKTVAKEQPKDDTKDDVKDDTNQGEDNQNQQDNSGNSDYSGGSSSDASGSDAYDGGGVYNGDVSSSGGSSSSTDASVPRVIVTGFDTNPANVKAGSDFTLTIHLKNTSKKTAVSNMLFDLQAPASGSSDETAEAPAFLPTSGSSSIYLDKIAANGTKDISIKLNARADLIQKPYSITMDMKYEDSSANQFEGTSSLAIPIKQEARFEFSDITVAPEEVSVGDEVNITCNIYNLGRVKMYNVKAKIQGDAVDGQEQFLGNIESGGTGAIDTIATATAETMDENNCKIVLSYEDDAGNVQTVEKEFTLSVSEAMDATGDSDMGGTEDTQTGSSPIKGIIALVAVVILVIAGTVVYKKRKKKKAVEAEEEELFDEVERSSEDELK